MRHSDAEKNKIYIGNICIYVHVIRSQIAMFKKLSSRVRRIPEMSMQSRDVRRNVVGVRARLCATLRKVRLQAMKENGILQPVINNVTLKRPIFQRLAEALPMG